MQGAGPSPCRFSPDSLFAHFVQNLKRPSLYTGPLELPDFDTWPGVYCFNLCEALCPQMYLLPVQILDLTTPIADLSGVVRRHFPLHQWFLRNELKTKKMGVAGPP